MKQSITISQAAIELGISSDTIRRWEKSGLIRASRNDNNHRLFSLDEITRLQKKMNGDDVENRYKILKRKVKKKYKAIDLFAGAGGTALGLENAGFEHLMVNEFDRHAAATLRKNKPNWDVIEDNVANVDFTKYKGKVDLIEGGFPCQSFSYAGKSLGFNDVRGTLFFEFARAVKEAQPKIAMGENVKGLHRHDDGKTLKTMLKILDDIGYDTAYRVLRSQYLDVPQKRERLIIIAVRRDLKIPIVFPKEKDYTISIREAIGDLPESEGQQYNAKKAKVMNLVPPGGYWRDLPEDIKKDYMGGSYFLGGGKTGMARRLSWDEPSLTLLCSPAQKQTERCHPEKTRPLNVREYARIQTFPDDWAFAGSISAGYKQIGNAVPVNLAYHIGVGLWSMLDGNIDRNNYEVVSKIFHKQK